MSAEIVVDVVERPAWRSAVVAFSAVRPQQWTSTSSFAGIVFAAKLGDASRWVEAVAALPPTVLHPALGT